MKKWWFHRVACICNLVATTIVLIFIIYKMFTSNDSAAGYILGIMIFSIGYTIYIYADIWGLKLYQRYKNLESLSITDKRKCQASLIFLNLIQVVIGSLVYESIDNYALYFKHSFEIHSLNRYINLLFPVIFLSGIIVIIGSVLLLNAISRNKMLIKNEIDAIGTNTA